MQVAVLVVMGWDWGGSGRKVVVRNGPIGRMWMDTRLIIGRLGGRGCGDVRDNEGPGEGEA